MNVGAADRETGGARLHRLAHDLLHERDVVVGRFLEGAGPLSHRIDPHRVVADHDAEIDGVLHGVDGVHVIGKRLPVPCETFMQRRAGNVLDAFHQAHEAIAVGFFHRREADAAIAHDHRGDAVIHGRFQFLVPGNLAVIMGVQVDEAGRHDGPCGVDHLFCVFGAGPDFGDASVFHADIGANGLAAVAVINKAAGDFEIESHARFL